MRKLHLVVMSAVVIAIPACARSAAAPAGPAPGDTTMPIAARVPLEDFARLTWLEGTWRGEGVGQPAFWERYRFLNDSTIRIESFTDSTLAGPPETGEVRWRDGMVTVGSSGALWVLTRRDRSFLHFDPVAGARNSFTWRRDSDDAWTAVLSWPAAGDAPARDRVYHLRRVQ